MNVFPSNIYRYIYLSIHVNNNVLIINRTATNALLFSPRISIPLMVGDSALKQFLYIKVLTIKTGAHALRRVICERKLISMQTFQKKRSWFRPRGMRVVLVVVSQRRECAELLWPSTLWLLSFQVNGRQMCVRVCVCNFCGHSRRCAEEKLRRLALWHLWRSDGDRCDRRRGGFKIYLYVRACACV